MYIRKKIYLYFRVRYIIISANKETKVCAVSCQLCVLNPRGSLRSLAGGGGGLGVGVGREALVCLVSRWEWKEQLYVVKGSGESFREEKGCWSTPRGGSEGAWGTREGVFPTGPGPSAARTFVWNPSRGVGSI